MAKGQIAKEEITKKILDTFSGAFRYDKEIRVPIMENGELVQIKVTLTAAKVNVEQGGESVIPGSETGDFPPPVNTPTSNSNEPIQPSVEEKASVATLLRSLGL